MLFALMGFARHIGCPHFYGAVMPSHPAAGVRTYCVPREPPLLSHPTSLLCRDRTFRNVLASQIMPILFSLST